uniref:Pyruvate carboxyltransferase domain-containing protein n=1 Tax=Aegilops tauschii subsp. strangulata TaxID=200361 RepID=A0A453JIM3_AEGTS
INLSKKIEIDPPHIKKIKIKSRSIPSAPILVERRRWWRWRAKPASLPGSTPLYGQASSGNTRGAAAADPLLCSRSDRVFLYHILGEVIKAGATSLSIPVGQHTPLHEFQELIADIKENTPGIENAIISTPCHDVLGLASANTLVGVFARAKQLEVTVTVSGERVGNSSMEEVVMEIKFSRELSGDLYTGVNTQGSTMKSKMMQEQSGLHAQLHNATLGAIAHEREINLECTEMLKFERTCEIASYVDIGLRRHVVRTKVVEHGYGITEKEFADLCKSSYKVVAEEQKPVAPLDSRMDITTLLYNTGQVVVVGRSVMDIAQHPVVLNTVLPLMRQMAWPCLRVIVVSGFGATLVAGVMAMYVGAMVILDAGSTYRSSTL